MEITNEISILIVDDEEDIREILEFNLENEGYQISSASCAEDALKILSAKHHNLILLDVMMGGMSGFKMADQIRKEGNNIPIIFLTAKDTENDMLTGFSIGGDDYISKPFSIKEVIARIKSVLKRSHTEKVDKKNNILNIGPISIDTNTKIVSINNEPVDLTKTEYNILTLLITNEDKIFSRSDILNLAWVDDNIVSERTVDVHITRLRKKMGQYGDAIVNRTGYGYIFNLDNVKI